MTPCPLYTTTTNLYCQSFLLSEISKLSSLAHICSFLPLPIALSWRTVFASKQYRLLLHVKKGLIFLWLRFTYFSRHSLNWNIYCKQYLRKRYIQESQSSNEISNNNSSPAPYSQSQIYQHCFMFFYSNYSRPSGE